VRAGRPLARVTAGLVLGITAGLASPALAADFAIRAVHRGDAPKELLVRLSQPLPPLTDVRCTAPDPCNWCVLITDHDKRTRLVAVVKVEVPPNEQDYANAQALILSLASEVPSDPMRVEVVLLLKNAPSQTLKTPAVAATSRFEAVDDEDKATLYFSGLVAPAAGDTTTYTIDSRANLILDEPTNGYLSILAEFKADKRANADPDTASLFAHYERYDPTFVYKWDVGGGEFDREGKVVNLMSRAYVALPLSHAILRRVEDPDSHVKISTVRASVGVDLEFGLEVGANAKYPDLTDDSSGTFIFRIVPQIQTYLTVPAPVIKKLVFSADYAARLPTTRELFLETRDLPDKADPVMFFTRRVRHHVTAGVKLSLTDYIGFKIEYEHGSLPPAFKVVDHSGKIGLVFQARQSRK
jgi:hypothetical protein